MVRHRQLFNLLFIITWGAIIILFMGSRPGFAGPVTPVLPTTSPSPSPSPGYSVIKLVSPKPSKNSYFGAENYFNATSKSASLWRHSWVELSKSRIAIAEPFYDEERGAVHIFSTTTGKVLASIVGTAPGNRIGSGGLYTLKNGNFVISSPFDDDAAKSLVNCGSLKLVDAVTYAVKAEKKGAASNTYYSGVSDSIAPLRDYIVVGSTNTIAVASPYTLSGDDSGVVDFLSGADLSALASLKDSAMSGIYGIKKANKMGSGGLTLFGENQVVIASPDFGITYKNFTKMGQIVVYDMTSLSVKTSYPFQPTTQSMNFEVISPNTRLGSGSVISLQDGIIVSSKSDNGDTANVGSLTSIDLSKRTNSYDPKIVSTRLFVGRVAGDLFGIADNFTGEGGLRRLPLGNSFLVLSPNATNGLQKSTAGTVHLFQGLEMKYLGGIAGSFAADRVTRSVVPLSNGNFLTLSPFLDANNTQDPLHPVIDIGFVGLSNSSNFGSITFWNGYSNYERMGYYGGAELNKDLFVFDRGKSITIAAASDGKEKSTILIPPNLKAEGPNANAFVNLPKTHNFAVISALTDDPNRVGHGKLYVVGTASGLVSADISGSPEEHIGVAGIDALAGGEIIMFNPTDSSRKISNAGSVWIVRPPIQ